MSTTESPRDDRSDLRTHDGVQARNAGAASRVERQLARGETAKDLSRLSAAEAYVYRSVEYEGLRPATLADYEDWSASTIRTLLRRARKKLGEGGDAGA